MLVSRTKTRIFLVKRERYEAIVNVIIACRGLILTMNFYPFLYYSLNARQILQGVFSLSDSLHCHVSSTITLSIFFSNQAFFSWFQGESHLTEKKLLEQRMGSSAPSGHF